MFDGSWEYDYREPHRTLLVSGTDRFNHTKIWNYAEAGGRNYFGAIFSETPMLRPLLSSQDGIAELLYDWDPLSGMITEVVTDWELAQDGNGDDYYDRRSSLSLTPNFKTEAIGSEIDTIYSLGPPSENSGLREYRKLRDVTYDLKGRVRHVATPDSSSQTLFRKGYTSYDEFSRPARLDESHIEAEVPIRAMEYDSEHQLVRVLKSGIVDTEIERDPLGRIVGLNHRGQEAQKVIAPDGLAVELIGPSSSSTKFSYDAARQLTGITWPDDGGLGYEYDSIGRLTKVTYPSGKEIDFGHDILGRIISIADDDGATAYTYDGNGVLNSATRGSRQITLSSDIRARVTSYTDVYGNQFVFTYDKLDNLTSIVYPDGATVEYRYDEKYTLTEIACDAWDMSVPVTWAFYSSPSGAWGGKEFYRIPKGDRLLLQEYYSSGPEQGYKDPLFETEVTAAALEPEPDEWDVSGTAVPDPSAWSFPAEVIYVRGVDGRVLTSDALTLSYDSDGNLIHDNRLNGLGALTWDGHGRLVSAGGVTYDYDPLGHLSSWSEGAEMTRFSMVPVENQPRILTLQSPAGDSTYYIYDPDGRLVAEYSAVKGPRYYHFDPIGNTQAIFDGINELSVRMYTPFGQVLAEGNWESPFGYRGEEGLPTAPNGLVSMGARHYDPTLHSFVSADPALPRIEVPASFDRYAFAFNDPTTYTDPTGLAPDTGDLLAHEVLERYFDPITHAPNVVGRISKIKGDVRIVTGVGGDSRAAKVGDLLFYGQVIETNASARVKIGFHDSGNDIVLGSTTSLVLQPPRGNEPPRGQPLELKRESVRPALPRYVPNGRGVFNIDITPTVVNGVRG